MRNETILMILVTSFLIVGLLYIYFDDLQWQYSSDGDLRGTQTKYIEAKHNAQVSQMNNIVKMVQINKTFNITIIDNTENTGLANLANPASTYCESLGYNLTIHTNPDTGEQIGYCNFSNGYSCEEWAFYRGECKDE